MVSPVKQIEQLNQRLEKARQIVAEGKVNPIIGKDNHYTIEGCDGFYLVNDTCSCPDAEHRNELHQGWCKHRLSVELYKEIQDEAKTKAEPKVDADLEAKIADLY